MWFNALGIQAGAFHTLDSGCTPNLSILNSVDVVDVVVVVKFSGGWTDVS